MQNDETNNTNVIEEVVEADVSQATEATETTGVVEQTEQIEETQSAETSEETNQTEEVAQEEGENDAPEQKPPSRREQLRIQQLLAKYGNPTERSTQQPSQPNRKDALDYSSALDADPEVIQQLEADRAAASNASYNEGLKRAEFSEWKMSLKIDAPVIEKKYPILDKNSPEFHPAVADALNSWYLKMSGFNPETQTVTNNDISYADFVESNMELVEEIAGQKNAQTVKNITKQAAQTGLRPDGSSAKRLDLTKDPSQMSVEELYAAIGQKPPKR